MKELEEVNCEIRRIVNLQFPVSSRLRSSESEEHGQSTISQEHDSDSEFRGGFLHNATYAWLSYGCRLIVFNVKIGESISSWTFRGIVTSVSQFPAQTGEFPLLLVGVDNCANRLKDSSGLLCIFDCTTSRVLRAIRMSCGVEQVCVVSGGAEWEEFNDKRSDNVLNEMDGIACVVLRNLEHIMIDLRRRTWDVYDLSSVMDETSPAELDFLSAKQVVGRHQSNREKHAAYNLLNRRIEKHIGFNREDFESSPLLGESLTTAIISSTKIGCLISGCLGRVIIWQNDGSIRWISAPIDDNMAVTHLALLEPTDDPRPFYYLWVVFQDELSRMPPVLRMYAMLFERKYYDRDVNLYFNLEDDPSLKFESELSEGDRIVGLYTVERESNSEQTESSARRGEDNLLLIATNERILLFDLNQWYKEQMPRTISECQNPNSILATYCTRSDVQNADRQVINFAYVPLSLQEFPSSGPNSPEELFYPNSLSFEWVELSSRRLTFWMTRGIQADLLREMAIAGPIILIQPSETFHRCLSVGLVPFNSEFTFASDQDAQREMLLSLCLEQRWSTFLVKCAVEWSDGSASYLYPTFLKWGIQRASTIKMIADRLCVPLFDQSGNSIGEADVKNLRFCSQQLECLSNVVGKLPSAGTDLKKQRRTLKRVSTYFQVLLWFYDVGLLPETQDLEDEEENTLPISLALRVPYPYERLSALYKEKRAQYQKDNNSNENEQDLFIDELITRECPMLKAQWEREGGTATGGYYPPPSLQSLLRSYLTDYQQTEASEISCKHQITIYLLMDLQAMLLQRLYPAVKQLIKYPSAFKMTPSLIKLTQAFWLLDHEDYQEFLDTMTGQLISDSDVKDWHHRLILRTLVRNNQHKLALVYLRVRKPPLSSLEEQGVAVSLSVEHGLVQSAFHRRPPCHYEQLLICFFRACKKYGKLNEILHLALDIEEEEVFIRFLEENKTEDLRLLYYLQRCRYTEAISNHPIRQYQSNFTKDIQSTSLSMLDAYNMTLPDVTKQFSSNGLAATSSDVDLKARYSRPMSHRKSHDRLRNIYETVITKARETYIRNEKYQIPFISVPCMSLKFNNYGSNMNCVSFPTLVRKSCSKRRIDQVHVEEDEEVSNTPDNAKRRKLSNGNILSSKSDSRESGLAAAFETPLVERKLNAYTKDNVAETPQSILKIRQLVKSSSSVASFQGEEIADRLSQNERKINRQIRFDINQSKKILTYEEEEEEENEEKKMEEEASGDETNVSSKASNEMSLNPSKSAFYESAILSDLSSVASSKIYCYARPRPSLRRSALSVESLQESCAKKVSGTSANSSAAFSSIAEENTSKRCSSSQSAYSTTLLSPGTSIDISYPNTPGRASPLEWALERHSHNKFTISSTPITKNIVSQKMFVKRAIRVDDNDKDVESESFMSNIKKEDLNVPGESTKRDEQSNYDRSNLEERDSPEKDVLQKKTESKSESKYNNGNVAREESPSSRNPCEEQPVFSEKVAETANLDESEDELLRLRDDGDDEDEHETFESLSTHLEDAQSEGRVSGPHLSETWNPGYQTEGCYDVAKSNGLRESAMQAMADVEFTDDESVTSARSATPMISNKTDNDGKKEHSISTAPSENIFYDLNITDDESDSNTREIEESRAKNGRFSNLQGSVNLQNPEAEKDQSESDEKKSDGRESVSKNAVDEVAQPDADDKDSNINVRSKVDETESVEYQEKLSKAEGSSKNKWSHMELENVPYVRITRSPRADSMIKDKITDASQVEPERSTRLRRGSSMTKDVTTDSSRNKTKKPPRRASLTTKSSPVDSRSTDSEEPPLLQRITSITSDLPTDSPSSQDTNPEKPPRLRRASSITTEVGSPGRSLRSRRASSLVKDVLTSSLIDENLDRPTTESGNSDASPSVKKELRSTSSTWKKTPRIEVKDSDSESVKDELPVRRSTRLSSSSTRKEFQEDAPRSPAKLISDDEEDKNTRKRSLRARKSSVSSDTDKPTKRSSSRLSMRDSDKKVILEEEELKEIKTSRRRGNSVPKEITMQTRRRSRSGSIAREIIPEVPEPSEEQSRTPRSFVTRNTSDVVNKLTRNTRSRSSSILSIPEELEEILSPPMRETRSSRKKTSEQDNIRERRASSADVTPKDVKRRTRNIRTRSIAVEPIVEESTEDEDRVRSQEDEQKSGVALRDTSTSKGRTSITTTVQEDTKQDTLKRKRGRSRKIDTSQESSLFTFSQPEKMDDVPLNEKGNEIVYQMNDLIFTFYRVFQTTHLKTREVVISKK
ncbi:AT-hook-containing transcription factor 1 [Camponotus floridanus]|uniref:AT-hook-containing transcription factor 1 n=1 Tax=Camponotus floridanus TaxID=104421 RepID=E2AJS1_CAMFO|nr:AT-hook-containing transcription factor 1 [Camponotus floridanus]